VLLKRLPAEFAMDRFGLAGVFANERAIANEDSAMLNQPFHDTEEIEEAGAAIMTGMRLLAEHLDPPTAHALATQLLDDLLRDLLKDGSHALH